MKTLGAAESRFQSASHFNPNPTQHMKNNHDPVFAPVGNFSPGFAYWPKPVSEHPCVCECEGCRQNHADRLIERERVRKITGV